MNEAQFEQKVRCLLAEACGSSAALNEGADLLETGLLDSLALITLLDGLEDIEVEIQPTQVERDAFRTADSIAELCKTFARQAGVVV